MTVKDSSFDRMFDRTWRPGHPFRPRLSAVRRWGMGFFLLVLLVVIGAYWTLTDSRRVKAMAEAYLSQLVGGRVEVKHATLSIFEGLRLDGVKVYAEPPNGSPAASQPGVAGGSASTSSPASSPASITAAPLHADDALVFTAATFLIKYNPDSILNGRLEATEIVAIDPQVHLCEDVSTGQWNYQRLAAARAAGKAGKLPVLPQISLRNGTIIYSQTQEGRKIAGAGGSTTIEGTFLPVLSEPGACDFRLQTRGESSELFANIGGTFHLATGQITAHLTGLKLGRDVQVMLPRVPRRWFKEHDLAGYVDIPVFEVQSPHNGQPADYRVVMNLRHITLAVLSQELMVGEDAQQVRTMQQAFDIMRMAGINYRETGLNLWDGQAAEPGQNALHAPSREPAANSESAEIIEQPAGFVDCMESLFVPNLHLQHVTGQFVFTPEKIEINKLRGELEGNAFDIDGHIDGYYPSAAAEIRLRGENFVLPDLPLYLGSVPRAARDLLVHLRPHGVGNIQATYIRESPETRPIVQGSIEVTDGTFCFDHFAYPLRHVTGTINFGPDPARPGQERCDVIGLRGSGIPGGPNEHRQAIIDCSFAPMTGDAEIHMTVQANNITCEPGVRKALPPEADQALSLFDPAGAGEMPAFRGDFTCTLIRAYGPYKPLQIELDVALTDASGAFKFFPYALRGVHGKLHINDDHVQVTHIIGYHDSAAGPVEVGVEGVVSYGRKKPIDPQLKITALHLPIDNAFLSALSPGPRQRLEKMGVNGMLDVDGNVFRIPGAPFSPPKPILATDGKSPATQPFLSEDAGKDIGYDFHFDLANALISPPGQKAESPFALSNARGKLHLISGLHWGSFEFSDVHAQRGKADWQGSGIITWPAAENDEDCLSKSHITFDVAARNLLLEPSLYALLPADCREAWDAVQPNGTLDAELHAELYAQSNPDRQPATVPAPAGSKILASGNLPVPETQASASPTRPTTEPSNTFDLTLRPRDLSATVKAMPYRLEHVSGTIHVDPRLTTLTDIEAHHGAGLIHISGTGAAILGSAPRDPSTQVAAAALTQQSTPRTQPSNPSTRDTGRSEWDLQISARDLPADDDLRRALPASFGKMVESLKMRGKISFDLTKIVYRSPVSPIGDPDVTLGGKLWLQNASLDLGVPVSNVNGATTFNASAHSGKLADLTAAMDFSTFRVAGQDVTGFHTDVMKPADRQAVRFDKLQAAVAGGALAGRVEFAFPDDAPSQFALALVLQNADLEQLTGTPADAAGKPPAKPAAKPIRGQIDVSLSLKGAWNDEASHRGRGDVVVTGASLYQIPLMMGLLQITNLSLPIASPFNDARASYNVEGQRVTFDQITLKAKNMIMQGSGSLDYASKKVSLTFTTDNPNGIKFPLIDQLLTGARHELLQIHVNGTVQDPKVSASMMDTITTTVDQVTRGGK